MDTNGIFVQILAKRPRNIKGLTNKKFIVGILELPLEWRIQTKIWSSTKILFLCEHLRKLLLFTFPQKHKT